METERATIAFKELHIWQKAIDFTVSILELTENLSTPNRHFRLIEQLESSSASVPQNIAEGKGRRSKKEFIHYLYIARGSLYEVMTLLILFTRKAWINQEQLAHPEQQAFEIVSMIKGLINSLVKSG